MVGDSEAFAIMAACFSVPSEEEWNKTASSHVWPEFLDALRRLLKYGACSEKARTPFRSKESLRESLSSEETSALFSPPSFEQLSRFAARHFMGGLPQSAVPVESLYVNGATHELLEEGGKGFYGTDVSSYMRDLSEALGLELAPRFESYPDHLSVELEVLAYLVDQKMCEPAWQFLRERFAWLTNYRKRLLSLGSAANFHLAIADVVLDIRAIAPQPDDVLPVSSSV